MNERVLTMWPQVRRSSGEPCPVCGSRMDACSQRVTASDLDERHQWWLTRHSCEGCGWAQDELAKGVSDEH
jgi:MinD superfamily P-loop ATPase